MILPFKSLREECPVAIQVIEKSTGYTYAPAHGTLTHKDTREPITFPVLEGFFDEQGLLMSVYPTKFPGWNGVLSDFNGRQIHNEPASFATANSRNHAKSLIAGITIKVFEEMLKQMVALPESYLSLERTDLVETAKEKDLEEIELLDLSFDARGLLTHSDYAILKDGKRAVVLKNAKKDFPWIGMVINVK